MHDRGKSDDPVVPAKLPNNAQGGAAEVVEGADRPRGTRPANALRTQSRQGAPNELDRVRRAQHGQGSAVHALLHHVDVDRLRALALKPKPRGGGRVTWEDYADLERTFAICMPVHRELPDLARVFIASGRRCAARSLRLRTSPPAALVEVLNAIYSRTSSVLIRFRRRSPHDALDALAFGILKRRVNWCSTRTSASLHQPDHQCWRSFLAPSHRSCADPEMDAASSDGVTPARRVPQRGVSPLLERLPALRLHLCPPVRRRMRIDVSSAFATPVVIRASG